MPRLIAARTLALKSAQAVRVQHHNAKQIAFTSTSSAPKDAEKASAASGGSRSQDAVEKGAGPLFKNLPDAGRAEESKKSQSQAVKKEPQESGRKSDEESTEKS